MGENSRFTEGISRISDKLCTTLSTRLFFRNYVLQNLYQPLYDVNTDVNVAFLYLADSGALTYIPVVTWNASWEFYLKLKYAELLKLTYYESSENVLTPVKQAFSMEWKYSFYFLIIIIWK